MPSADVNIRDYIGGPDQDEVAIAPCSFAQQRMWVLERMQERASTYNVELMIRFTGVLDEDAVDRAVAELVMRHETLRTTFELERGELVQVIAGHAEARTRHVDLSGRVDPEAALRAFAATEIHAPFDTRRGPLLRSHLLRLDATTHVLLVVLDHLICDGASVVILYDELTTIYRAHRRGAASPLDEPGLQYADYAQWERDLLDGPTLTEQLDYWRGVLADPPARLNLPCSSGADLTGMPETLRIPVPGELLAAIDRWALLEKASRASILHAGLCAVLARYCGATDITTGAVVAHRTRTELERIVGFFVNTVVLRVDASGDPTASVLLRRARDTALDAYARQDVPFDRVVEDLNPDRATGQPFFDVMFQYVHQDLRPVVLDEVVLEPCEPSAPPAPVTLVVSAMEAGGRVDLIVDYDGARFTEDRIAAFGGHYLRLLAAMATAPDTRLSDLPMLGDTELATLTRWSTPATAPVAHHLLHSPVTARAAARPDDLAVTCDGRQLTYGELDRRSSELAVALRGREVAPDSLVGLAMPRGIDQVVALLAVSKAGGGFMPLDPAHPDDRLRGMIADAAPALILTEPVHHGRFAALADGHCTVTSPGDLTTGPVHADGPDGDAGPDHVAYVIFTSGSTGRPKGAAITHRGVATIVAAQLDLFGLGQDDRVLQVASPGFDASIFEMLMAFGAGACLHIATDEERRDLAATLRDATISAAVLTPAALTAAGAPELPELRVLTVAGEACPPALVSAWAGRTTMFNLYGPTEATIWSTVHPITPVDAARPFVPLGVPVDGVTVRVLDAAGRPVPAGVWGEAHLAGEVLARGYLGRPRLTADRFVPDAWSTEPGARLYRTGDLVRWDADGVLEFGGRIDRQVKVRGHRVEPGEVEATLAGHPAVVNAFVSVRGEGPTAHLVGYVSTGATGMLSEEELREHCRGTLPDHMVPAVVVVLDRLPLNVNGKIDRAALPDPVTTHDYQDGADRADSGHPQADHNAPTTELELVIAGIWQDVLGREQIGLHDDFFDLGGHSLLATLTITRIQDEFDLDVPVRTVFDHPTLATFVDALLTMVADQTRHPASPEVPPTN